jgi:hypothetical protein
MNTIPSEIADFMFEVLYSDGTPGKIKQSAFELINHHSLQMGEVCSHGTSGQTTLPVVIGGIVCSLPKDKALEIEQDLARGLKINAIKNLREWATQNNFPNSLKECKDTIDGWRYAQLMAGDMQYEKFCTHQRSI